MRKVDMIDRGDKLLSNLLLSLKDVRGTTLPYYPLILIFASEKLDECACIPMLRHPIPERGFPFEADFPHRLHDAWALNPSIHDGAILFVRDPHTPEYTLDGWSMRIVSAAQSLHAEANRGSAYNSAVSLSMNSSVDLCCIYGEDSLETFVDGTVYEL